MPNIDLHTLLNLVGTLDDNPSSDSASSRFRAYLTKNVPNVSDLRDYVNMALSTSGDQYNKALQDLINRIGQLLGFEVEYGRYRGVPGQIGFDGLWRSPIGKTFVMETKTTDVYAIKTATLLGYINDLVSVGRLQQADQAIGLYVYGRFDTDASQLEKAIIAERRQEQLRVASVDSLLNLLELKQEYQLEHQTIVQLLLPFPVRVDTVVNLIFDIVSQEKREAVEEVSIISESESERSDVSVGQPNYYLLPAADSEDGTPTLDNLHRWLDRGMWGLGQRTGYRRFFRIGDHLCFYGVRIGTVVECTAASSSFELSREQSPEPHLDVPYAIRVKDVRWFEDTPVVLVPEVRAKLTAFQGRDPIKAWAWFVQGTSKLTKEDFELLTGKRRP